MMLVVIWGCKIWGGFYFLPHTFLWFFLTWSGIFLKQYNSQGRLFWVTPGIRIMTRGLEHKFMLEHGHWIERSQQNLLIQKKKKKNDKTSVYLAPNDAPFYSLQIIMRSLRPWWHPYLPPTLDCQSWSQGQSNVYV